MLSPEMGENFSETSGTSQKGSQSREAKEPGQCQETDGGIQGAHTSPQPNSPGHEPLSTTQQAAQDFCYLGVSQQPVRPVWYNWVRWTRRPENGVGGAHTTGQPKPEESISLYRMDNELPSLSFKLFTSRLISSRAQTNT